MLARISHIGLTALTIIGLFAAPFLHRLGIAQDAGWVDVTAAQYGIPYAKIANDVYSDTPGSSISGVCNGVPCVWARAPESWQAIFNAGLKTEGLNQAEITKQISRIAASGFYAAVYTNNQSQEIVLAFRGTVATHPQDLAADAEAATGVVPAQYKEAVQFATFAQSQYKGHPITAVGDSKGGAQATYAAQQSGRITTVVTTSPARPPFISQTNPPGVKQTNYVVPGEFIGDCNTGVLGGCAPGRTFSVRSTTEQPAKQGGIVADAINDWRDVTGAHKVSGIIAGLQNVVTSQNAPAKLPSTSSQTEVLTSPAGAMPSHSPPGGITIGGVRPGGISLSKAAAERMPLNLSFEGAYFNNGRLIFSGHESSGGIDAALILTAMRAACENEDLYFSLDPDNGAAWLREGQEATSALWKRIRENFKSQLSQSDARRTDSILEITTVSARRDYTQIWESMSPQYPDLQSRLVFKPEWLRQTRLGAILYKADVLLKELSYGVPILASGPLRAKMVSGYASAGEQGIAKQLLSALEKNENAPPEWRGSRLWFDLIPERAVAPTNAPLPWFAPVPVPAYATLPMPQVIVKDDPLSSFSGRLRGKHPGNSFTIAKIDQLRGMLKARGLLATPHDAVPPAVSVDEGAIDLSRVSPRMFVRRHDQASGQDLPGEDPDLDDLAKSVNGQIEDYAEAYQELHSLSEVFRAYVAAVQLIPKMADACSRLHKLPLLDTEKLTEPLPEHHPSELFITIGLFEFSEGRTRRLLTAQGFGINGGVSVGAKTFLSANLRSTPTTVTELLLQAIVRSNHLGAMWQFNDRKFIAFDVEDGLPQVPRRVASNLPWSVGPITLPQPQPMPPSAGTGTNGAGALGIIGFIFGTLVLWMLGAGLRGSSLRKTAAAAASPASRTFTTSASPIAATNPPNWQDPHQAAFEAAYAARDQADVLHRWMRMKRCGRSEAMRFAVEDWRKIQASKKKNQREFDNVFAMKSATDKEQMIRSWLARRSGSREEAMKQLVEDWRRGVEIFFTSS